MPSLLRKTNRICSMGFYILSPQQRQVPAYILQHPGDNCFVFFCLFVKSSVALLTDLCFCDLYDLQFEMCIKSRALSICLIGCIGFSWLCPCSKSNDTDNYNNETLHSTTQTVKPTTPTIPTPKPILPVQTGVKAQEEEQSSGLTIFFSLLVIG